MKRSFRSTAALVTATLLAATLTPTAAAAAPAVPTSDQPPTVRCEFTPTPDNPAAKPVTIPSPIALAAGKVDVYFVTNFGPFVVRMDRANAPCGVSSFVHLTKSRFYDRTQSSG
jgi:peptidyl-prolyl cis-trans isomerase B (cyclophilin B)